MHQAEIILLLGVHQLTCKSRLEDYQPRLAGCDFDQDDRAARLSIHSNRDARTLGLFSE
jgi:hypothetical protein